MNVAMTILEECRVLGLSVRAESGILKVAPGEKLSEPLRQKLTARKPELLRVLAQDSMNAYHEQAVDRLNQFQWAPGQIDWPKIRARRDKLETDITAAWNKVDIERYKQAVDEWEALFLTQAREV